MWYKNGMETWCAELNELNRKGYDVVAGRLRFPDGHYTEQYPQHWTAEMCVHEASAYIALLEREATNLTHVTMRRDVI